MLGLFDDYTDEQLRELEELLYEEMVAGDSDAAERHDDVIVEMNRRGMMDDISVRGGQG